MTSILIVEDDVLVRSSLTRALAASGFTVTSAANGREALEALGRVPHDICLFDVQLPDTNGISLMDQARSLVPGAGFIIMTAYDFIEAEEQVRLKGGYYLPKPFDLHVLRSLIQKLACKGDAPGSSDCEAPCQQNPLP